MKTVLVVGGAGYIGSVVVKKLCELNYSVLVLDNLSKGRLELVDKKANFTEGDILDYEFLRTFFEENKFDSVIHFAAAKDAGESMVNLDPYSNNIIGTINVLKCMDEFNVKQIIFSSSAAVYGVPEQGLVEESHKTEPINYYGFTKLECERLFKWYKDLKGINFISLRYFNIAGDGGLDYIDPNAKNIFPIIAEAAFKIREKVLIYGNDYDTRDGTGIRDYIHVEDLADAHINSLNLEGSHVMNLGTSKGYSVMELVQEFEKVCGKFNYEVGPRREGDPGVLLASSEKAKKLINWNPKKTIVDMVESTCEVYKNEK